MYNAVILSYMLRCIFLCETRVKLLRSKYYLGIIEFNKMRPFILEKTFKATYNH